MQVKDADFRWAAAMAEFGMLLRNSRYKGKSNWTDLIERATAAADGDNDREEAIQMIRRAATLP